MPSELCIILLALACSFVAWKRENWFNVVAWISVALFYAMVSTDYYTKTQTLVFLRWEWVILALSKIVPYLAPITLRKFQSRWGKHDTR